MRRVLFEFPFVHIRIFGFGLMLCLAVLAAILLADWRARREKLNRDWVYDLSWWVMLSGLAGARAFYVWQYWGRRVHAWPEIFAIWEGGLVFYGGLIGGTLGAFACMKFHRMPLLKLCDLCAPSLALGIAIGRIGCFLNGCCYGDPCDLPWGVRFPAESPPWYQQVDKGSIVFPAPTASPPYGHYDVLLRDDGGVDQIVRDRLIPAGAPPTPPFLDRRVFEGPDSKRAMRIVRGVSVSLRSLPVHPTQLYSALDGFMLLGLLSAFYRVRRRDGEVLALFLVAYPISRALIEYLRGDEGVFFAGMTISQNVSLLVFLVGVAFWSCLRRMPARELAASTAETSPDTSNLKSVGVR